MNVEYMYAFAAKRGENAVIIFRFGDPEAAIKLLTGDGVTVIPAEEVYNL